MKTIRYFSASPHLLYSFKELSQKFREIFDKK